MESPESGSRKKRGFPGESSSAWLEEEVEILETAPFREMISRPSPSKKKEVVCEVIDIDSDEDCENALLIDGKDDVKGKGKEIATDFAVQCSTLSNERSKNVDFDDPSSNLFVGEDAWMEKYYDDIMFDDAFWESQFDQTDIPHGAEVPFPSLPSSPQISMSSTTPPSSSLKFEANGTHHVPYPSTSPSLLKVPEIKKQSIQVNKHMTNDAVSSMLLEPTAKIVGGPQTSTYSSTPTSSSSKTKVNWARLAPIYNTNPIPQMKPHETNTDLIEGSWANRQKAKESVSSMLLGIGGRRKSSMASSSNTAAYPNSGNGSLLASAKNTKNYFGSNGSYPSLNNQTPLIGTTSWNSNPGVGSVLPPTWQSNPGAGSVLPPAWQSNPGAGSVLPPAWHSNPGAGSVLPPAWHSKPGTGSVLPLAWHSKPGIGFGSVKPIAWNRKPSGFMSESGVGLGGRELTADQNEKPPVERNLDEIFREFEGFKKFDTVDDCSDHHYGQRSSNQVNPPKNWAKRIQEEWRILEKDLPEMIFVRVYESRMDLLRAVIVGAEGTPYHDGLFFFDVLFPSNYPDSPPQVFYHSGGLRLNPNLYNCGKVCLSLLNTWPGRSQKERWIPGVSTMLQVLVSIQGLILNAQPFYNEPGYANMSGTPSGEQQSFEYNETAFIYNLQTMMYSMKRPPKHFEAMVAGHFCKHARDILVSCKAYMDGAQVGCLVRGGIQDVDEGDKSCSEDFKYRLSGIMTMLIGAFSRSGVKNCEEFLSLAQKAKNGPPPIVARPRPVMTMPLPKQTTMHAQMLKMKKELEIKKQLETKYKYPWL